MGENAPWFTAFLSPAAIAPQVGRVVLDAPRRWPSDTPSGALRQTRPTRRTSSSLKKSPIPKTSLKSKRENCEFIDVFENYGSGKSRQNAQKRLFQ
jgi:hypothetical protein